jgi:heptosyltransferase-2
LGYGKNIEKMRVLAVNGFYPPFYLSGYDLGCRDLVDALRSRGHQVEVLTSHVCLDRGLDEKGIHRWLKPHFREKLDWRGAILKELVNQTAFKRVCRDFVPEVSLFFDLTYISASLGLLARAMGIPSAYYIANLWYLVYEKDHWVQVWPKGGKDSRAIRYFGRRYRLLPPEQPLHFGQTMFANSYLRSLAEQVDLPRDSAAIIPWGIDVRRFSPRPDPNPRLNRLLFVGQVRPGKNVDQVIRTLGTLRRDHGRDRLSLSIVGSDPWDPSPRAQYQKFLRALVEAQDLQGAVRFTGWVPPETMPSIYREHDIFLFPGTDEGSTSLALLEAMASGLAVVGTLTNAHADYLKDGDNALVFPKGDVDNCARQVLRLLDDPSLFESLRNGARAAAERAMPLERAAEAMEGQLKEAVLRGGVERPAFAAGKSIFLADPSPKRDLGRLTAPAKWWLRLGALAVTARAFLRPRFLLKKGKKLIYKATSLALLVILPPLFEAFFQLSGRRSGKRKSAGPYPSNILVIQLADIGDVLLSSPFLRELRRYRPRAWIRMVVQPAMVDLVEKCPYVDEVIPFRWRSLKDWGNAFSGHPRWWVQTTGLSARRLWSRRIDMAISLRWNNDAPQAAALTLMFTSGAPERVGYRDVPRDRIPCRVTDINRLLTRGPVRSYLRHEIELQLEILASLGAAPSDSQVEVWTGQEDEDFARDLLKQTGLAGDSPIIALAPGAAWPFRRWPTDRYIALGRWLQEAYGAKIAILAAGNELSLADEIEAGLHKDRTVNLGGKTTIRQLAAVLRHCRLFIGNDSGPLHLAAGMGTPVVGFFGPGEYERFRPWGSRHEALRLGLPCSPCSQNCAFDSPRCIRGISLARAKEAIAASGALRPRSDRK